MGLLLLLARSASASTSICPSAQTVFFTRKSIPFCALPRIRLARFPVALAASGRLAGSRVNLSPALYLDMVGGKAGVQLAVGARI